MIAKQHARKALIGATLALASIAPMAGTVAHAEVNGIQGSTTWDAPCNFYTSSNARRATGNTIKVTLDSVGKLGVKFRVLYTVSGLTSTTGYWSGGSSTAKTLSTNANKREFRNQYSCQNGRTNILDRPSTNFSGSLNF